jgi:hypothetical protein
MELQTAIEILEYHQEWRLGKREDMIHDPKKLTEALDIVLSEVKKISLSAGWISIEAKMPPLNENVLVFDDFHRMNICKRMDDVGYKIWNTESIIIGITHWMQLPSKPACS